MRKVQKGMKKHGFKEARLQGGSQQKAEWLTDSGSCNMQCFLEYHNLFCTTAKDSKTNTALNNSNNF